ncbi:hypothetical protein J6590_078886 [Homalodisca vitripennis]|nr:hypothetical protein J6590_078886 [Homalodisca vitripennis]
MLVLCQGTDYLTYVSPRYPTGRFSSTNFVDDAIFSNSSGVSLTLISVYPGTQEKMRLLCNLPTLKTAITLKFLQPSSSLVQLRRVVGVRITARNVQYVQRKDVNIRLKEGCKSFSEDKGLASSALQGTKFLLNAQLSFIFSFLHFALLICLISPELARMESLTHQSFITCRPLEYPKSGAGFPYQKLPLPASHCSPESIASASRLSLKETVAAPESLSLSFLRVLILPV